MEVGKSKLIKLIHDNQFTPTAMKKNSDGRTYSITGKQSYTPLRKFLDSVNAIGTSIVKKDTEGLKAELKRIKSKEFVEKTYTVQIKDGSKKLSEIKEKIFAFNNEVFSEKTIASIYSGTISEDRSFDIYKHLLMMSVEARDNKAQALADGNQLLADKYQTQLEKCNQLLTILDKKLFKNTDEITAYRIKQLPKAENLPVFLSGVRAKDRKRFQEALEKSQSEGFIEKEMEGLLGKLTDPKISTLDKFNEIATSYGKMYQKIQEYGGGETDRELNTFIIMPAIAQNHEKWGKVIGEINNKKDQVLKDLNYRNPNLTIEEKREMLSLFHDGLEALPLLVDFEKDRGRWDLLESDKPRAKEPLTKETVVSILGFEQTENPEWTSRISDMVAEIMTGKASKEESIAAYDQMVDLGIKARALGNKDLAAKVNRALSMIDVVVFLSRERAMEHRIQLLAKEENFEALAAAHTGTSEELKKIIDDEIVQEKLNSIFKILSSDENFQKKFEKFVKEYEDFSKQIDTLTNRTNDRDFKSGVLMALLAKDYKNWKKVIEEADSLTQKKEAEIKAMEPGRERNALLNLVSIYTPSALVGFLEALGSIPTLVDFTPKDRWGRKF